MGRATSPQLVTRWKRLVADGVAVIEATGAAPCHWVGLSTGGFVGMRLGIHHGGLLRSLVLMDTSALAEELLKKAKYEAMFAAWKLVGPRPPLISEIMKIMLGPSFLADPANGADSVMWRERFYALDSDIAVLHAFARAIFGRDDVTPKLDQIDVPTLVMVGDEDTAQTPAKARQLADGIPGAELLVVPRAGHLASVANPTHVTDALLEFLAGL